MKVYTTNSLIGSTKQSLGSNACLCVLGMQCVRAHLPLAGCHAQGHAGHEIGVLPTRETPGHNQALCRPMQRQARQAEVVCRALHNVPVTLPHQSWNNWCKQLAVVDCAPNRADLHVLRQARKVRAIARQASVGAQSQASSQSSRQKKSAAPPLPKSAPTTRTPFRLRNVRPVIRPGSKSEKIDVSSRKLFEGDSCRPAEIISLICIHICIYTYRQGESSPENRDYAAACTQRASKRRVVPYLLGVCMFSPRSNVCSLILTGHFPIRISQMLCDDR